MEKQTRRLRGFVNPDIVPVDQDQWDRLKQDIDSIAPLSEKYANMKWATIGFSGSLVISNVFYLFSSPPSLTIVYASAALLVGLFMSALILNSIASASTNSQKQHISRCQGWP